MPLQYRIEFAPSNDLILRIEEKGSRRILYLDTLQALAQEEDRKILPLLIKIQRCSPKISHSSDLSFQQICIPLAQSCEVLSLLAKTNRLFYKSAQIQWECFPSKLYWRGEKHSATACTLRAIVQTQKGEISLEECEKISPFWCLVRSTFFPLAPHTIPWKWVELFSKGPARLEGIQQKRFLEEDPPVIWQELSLPKKSLEVFPQLVVWDATGCFANLRMEYPGLGRIPFEDFSPTIAGHPRLKKEETSWEQDLLEAGFIRKLVGDTHYYCPGDKVRETLILLLDLGWKLFDLKERPILRQKGCEWQVREEGNRIAVQGKVHFQQSATLSLQAAQAARGLWVELDGNRVGLIDARTVPFKGEWEGETLFVKKASLAEVGKILSQGKVEWEDSLRQMVEGLQDGYILDPAPPDPSFQGTLLPYQQKGVDWLAFLQKWGFSALLADEMGLGKTVQVLAFFSRLRTNLPILIVTPSSLLYHWRSEIEKFSPQRDVLVYAGADRARALKGLVITSYAILRMEAEFFASQRFEVIVLDESNAIKTALSQTAQASFRLQSRFKIALTGTPMENRPEELASQFRFLMPELLGDLPVSSPDGLDVMRRKIRPFLLRRKKSDVDIELPEKMEQILWVDMNEAQTQLYDSYLAQVKGGLLKKVKEDGVQAHKMEILEAILRLRQIACDPRLVGGDVCGAKLELLLQNLGAHKILIFSQFTSMLHLIGRALHDEGRDYLYLDGTVSAEKRAHLVKRFQEDPDVSLFLLSLKAGGVGLNLTAAEYVLLFDPWWNDAVEQQAIDRAHRIGQKKTVIATRYLSPNTIEEKMLRLKQDKKDLATLLVDGEAFNGTEEDWLHLLS